MQLFSPAFSRGSFSKTERNGSGGGMMKRGSFGSGRVGSGRVGSGRVGWTPFFTRLDPSLTLFRGALIIVPFTVHFALLAQRPQQAVLSLDKLSKKKA